MKKNNRRNFIKTSAKAAAATYIATMGFSAKSYANSIGANDRVRLGVIGFADRFRQSHLPCFMEHYKELNFDIVALSDIWKLRREEGQQYLKQKLGHEITACNNNDELHAMKDIDGVFIASADFQHALHATDAVKAKRDVYCEKPFAETMDDARIAFKTIKASDRIVQIGSQRRSGANYMAAAEFVQSGKFGPITMVELTWNVNQPGRWRRPALVAKCREEDLDWKRYLMNRPFETFDPRKYLEFRLFWPYSSGMPGQWMSHQIDTVHWFSGLHHPRSVTANGGIYQWKDGRRNWDTTTAAFDYGPEADPSTGFQVVFMSRMHNGDDNPAEIYYSNGGEMNLITNKVSPNGGLTEDMAK
ncbi:MAG: Gfo/Idh/MocA family oxidoreductase, partial [Ferruginibacter sp.]